MRSDVIVAYTPTTNARNDGTGVSAKKSRAKNEWARIDDERCYTNCGHNGGAKDGDRGREANALKHPSYAASGTESPCEQYRKHRRKRATAIDFFARTMPRSNVSPSC